MKDRPRPHPTSVPSGPPEALVVDHDLNPIAIIVGVLAFIVIGIVVMVMTDEPPRKCLEPRTEIEWWSYYGGPPRPYERTRCDRWEETDR